MKRALALLVVVACGDGPPVLTEVIPECHQVPQPGGEAFETPASLDAVAPNDTVPGTLAGWDPNGRWFLTGTSVGSVSSYFFERDGSRVIVDRDEATPGFMNDTYLFQRGTVMGRFSTYLVVKRVSNRMPDGTLRGERVVCDGTTCNVCTAKHVYATRNADEGESDHISLVGQLNEPAWPRAYTLNVRVVGDTAYLIRRAGTPARPQGFNQECLWLSKSW